ncbi:hypothetical protein [Pseudomonas putida]|uniref:Oligosaccharide repeat unit polymerase n=1 Tax=Pseudomonas putida TaxID=303 RepID=A0A177S942_PSEPU|nr:hypothetical protein [Pseudomonas putida]OAI83821.1 hypothetical protein AYO28_04480 [Pseudomonas putida]
MIILLVLMCLLILVSQCIMCLLSKKYLIALYTVCYSVPFLGLISCLWSDTVTLWPIGGYDFSVDDAFVLRLTLVWSLGVAGGLLAFLLSLLTPVRSLGARRSSFFSPADFKAAGVLFFVACVVLIGYRFVNIDSMLEAFTGTESVMVFSIIAVVALALVYPSRLVTVASVLLVLSYCVANAMTGDRDFVVLFVACMLGLMYRYSSLIKLKTLFFVSLFMLLLLSSGVVISMVRMDVVLTSDNIAQFFLFNSWNAVILPLVEQLTHFWDGEHLRYGQTYIDMFLSLAPSPVYSLFGMMKPISVDNPALWYIITGMGGIHVAGVAFENFGLFGVFINGFISVCFLRLIDSGFRENDYLRALLYMLCASSVMHWTWYGEMYLLNALVFYLMSLALFLIIRLLRV